jgi:hypothetical protein
MNKRGPEFQIHRGNYHCTVKTREFKRIKFCKVFEICLFAKTFRLF